MKKIILSALAVCAFTFSNAQETETSTETAGFAKGDMFISGQVGFNTTSTGDVKNNDFSFAPRAAFFVSDNIAVGAKLEIGSDKADNGVVDTQDDFTLGFGAMARYYFTPASKFSLFGEFGVNYSSIDNKLTGADFKSSEFDLMVGPGINYFVSNNFAIEAGWGALGYSSNDNGGATGVDATNKFGLNVNMDAITFGLLYKF